LQGRRLLRPISENRCKAGEHFAKNKENEFILFLIHKIKLLNKAVQVSE